VDANHARTGWIEVFQGVIKQAEKELVDLRSIAGVPPRKVCSGRVSSDLVAGRQIPALGLQDRLTQPADSTRPSRASGL
jgi:hypothetical protein